MILNGREVEIDEVQAEAFRNEREADVIIFSWIGNIGFGEYTLYKDKDSDIWKADSETMDRGEDKEFIRLLLDKFVEGLEVVR